MGADFHIFGAISVLLDADIIEEVFAYEVEEGDVVIVSEYGGTTIAEVSCTEAGEGFVSLFLTNNEVTLPDEAAVYRFVS